MYDGVDGDESGVRRGTMVCDEAAWAGRPRRAEGMSVGGGRAVSDKRGGERRGVGDVRRAAPGRWKQGKRDGREGTNVVSVSAACPATVPRPSLVPPSLA